ncbi:four-carbon acid sugar kinase family protein [Paraburkholderia sp.]|uniref:four-carbon acid sugar kinase family protein n=1 Tax=Paraburkholderia sp. TaxID=1926495 RepID=UPI002382D825|nr:four-carbon acid sugar kinase family protein [Paraburkholderia sp.]MDE1184272.1 four-carbon acid sugar kinase family protein [Paraburkholderia sp.]
MNDPVSLAPMHAFSSSGHRSPAYAFYGDDFTGATDTLAHLARAGLRTMLFVEAPDAARLAQFGPGRAYDALDAIGVAGIARALAPSEMHAELTRVGACFASLGVRLMHYKVCSTFDSAPQTGSIGVAVNTLRAHFPNPLVAIVGGQPNLKRYCVFGQLFASAGGDEIFRIDRHPTMSHHPVTPMNEADLRVHLQRQGLADVRSIDWRIYAQAPHALDSAVAHALEAKPDALLFDVLDDAHLTHIGRTMTAHAAHAPLLAVGPSSVAHAYADAVRASAPSSANEAADAPDTSTMQAADGPVFVLAGSLSPATAAQIGAAQSYTHVELDPSRMTGAAAHAYLDEQTATIAAMLRDGRHVLAFTRRMRSTHADNGARDDADAGRNALAIACAHLLKTVLGQVRLRRIGIAGGDTSSFAIHALDVWGLSYLSTLAPGVAMCRLHADRADLDGIEVMLKGGQMGGTDLFERLLPRTCDARPRAPRSDCLTTMAPAHPE